MARSMEARQGRGKQRYADDGARVVAGGIVHHPTEAGRILVVSSEARPEHWVLPKGGAETDETLEEAALRETWEEAGAVCKVRTLVGTFLDRRPPKHWTDSTPPPPRTIFYIYELTCEALEDVWPEASKRRRAWMTYEEAHAAMLAHHRDPLAAALAASSLGPGADAGAGAGRV